MYYLFEKLNNREFKSYPGDDTLEKTLNSSWKSEDSLWREILQTNAYTNTPHRILIQKRDNQLISIYHVDQFHAKSNTFIDHVEYENYNLAMEECRRKNSKCLKYRFQLRQLGQLSETNEIINLLDL